MTRETKIGLLVGLAFIIVIGILLSDHMAATTEPPVASMETVARNARDAVVVPGVAQAPIIQQVVTPNNVVPDGQIPTQRELTAQRPVREITIGAPNNNTANIATPDNGHNALVADTHSPNRTHDNIALPDNRLDAIARANGEELVIPGRETSSTNTGEIRTPSSGNTTLAATNKTYIAQAGDNLNRIALKAMGANTKANRDAIVKANPSLKDNPNRIVVGQSYTIPTAGAATVATTSAPGSGTVGVLRLPTPAPTPTRTVQPSGSSGSGSPSYVYVVKAGDTGLWMIAREQLGTSSAVAAIKELNKDVLKGSDVIRPGMRLKLPAKPVASAD